MTTVADYVGRTVDLLAYDGATARGEVLLTQALAQPGQGGKICTGTQKLAQRFIMEFLTKKGSMRYLRKRGTDFIAEAQAGYFRTPADVYGAFARAMVDVKRNLRAEESESDPDDERYASAELLSLAFAPGIAKLYIKVLSRAGTSREVILPLPISV